MYKPLSNRHCQYREMAEKQKRIRRRRSEEQIIKKKVFDQARGKTRVNIGVAFQRWREVRELKGLKTDEELAILLLDSFEKELYISSTYLDERFGRSPPPMSSTGSHRLPERLREDFNMEVQNELEKSTSSAIAKLEVSIDWEEGVSEELDSDTDSADLDFECVSVEPDNDTDGANQDDRSVPEELDINSDGAYPDPEGVPENLDNDTDNADPDHEKVDNDTEDADADADSDSDVNPEELDINTDSDDPDCEGVSEEPDINNDSEDPDYTPQMSELQASVRQKRLSSSGVIKGEIISRPVDQRLLGPVTGLPAPCTEELLRTDISRRIEETLRHLEPEQSSSHEQTQERRPEVLKQYEGRPRLKKNYNCLTCGKSFRHNHHLQRHLVVHSGERPFHCPICERAFTQSGNLKTHMKIHRGKVPNWRLLLEKSPPTESPVTVNVCGECGMDFPQKEQLEEHSKSHKKPYECPFCCKTFKNEYHFKVHKRVHSGDLPFLCKECGKGFITASSLKTHEYTHTGEKNFRCDQCGRAFAQSSQLNMHIRTHTGERPHLCSVCGKSYSKAFDLKVHLRVHTGEKPYMCEKCGKCFYYYNGYRQHLRIHDKKPKPPTKPLGRPKQQRLVFDNQ